MSEASNPSTMQSPPPQELHWGIAYLREDIQTLRQDMHQAIQGVRQELRENVQGMHQAIQGVRQELRENVQELRQEIRLTHTRIDGTNQRIDSTNQRIDEKYELLNKAIRSQFTWLMTTMIALASIIVAVIKL